MIDKTYLQQILKFNKEDIYFYIIFGTIIFYIFHIYQISINYLLPFIIFCFIIYYRQDYLQNTNLQDNNKLKEINNNILHNNFLYLQNNQSILYFLDDIKIYKKYNSQNFQDLLEILNKYYKLQNIDTLVETLDIFNRFIYALPIQLVKDFYINLNRLRDILYKNLKSNNNRH